VPIVYPELDSDDWFVSGYADAPGSVARTAVCVDQRAGDGRVVIFPSDPNRRGMPEGMHRVLWNAMFGPNRIRDRGLPARRRCARGVRGARGDGPVRARPPGGRDA